VASVDEREEEQELAEDEEALVEVVFSSHLWAGGLWNLGRVKGRGDLILIRSRIFF
jgi:hypothetical protein